MSKELRKTIIEVFRKFSMDPHHSPLKKQKDREIAGRFIDRLHTTTFDSGSLPYYSSNGLAKHTNKAECVLAMMCDIVLDYWSLEQATGSKDDYSTDTFWNMVTSKLKQLDAVYRTYEQLKVLGDEKGYCLLKSLRKDLYGHGRPRATTKGEETGTKETAERADSTVEGGEEEKVITYNDPGIPISNIKNPDALTIKGVDNLSVGWNDEDLQPSDEHNDVCDDCAGSGTAVGEGE